jgi:hypothetical protein
LEEKAHKKDVLANLKPKEHLNLGAALREQSAYPRVEDNRGATLRMLRVPQEQPQTQLFRQQKNGDEQQSIVHGQEQRVTLEAMMQLAAKERRARV